jgi:hypothetical protein
MAGRFYSENPSDYRVGDEVLDRVTGEKGIVQKIRTTVWGSTSAIIDVFIPDKGITKPKEPANLSLISRNGIPVTGDFPKKSLREEKPTAPTPSDEELIRKGKIETEDARKKKESLNETTKEAQKTLEAATEKKAEKQRETVNIISHSTTEQEMLEKSVLEMLNKEGVTLPENAKPEEAEWFNWGVNAVINNMSEEEKNAAEIVASGLYHPEYAMRSSNNPLKRPIYIVGLVESQLRTSREKIQRIEKHQAILRKLYAGWNNIPKLEELLEESMSELPEDMRIKIRSLMRLKPSAVEATISSGHIKAKNRQIREAAIAAVEMLEKHKKRMIQGLNQERTHAGKFLNALNNYRAENVNELEYWKSGENQVFTGPEIQEEAEITLGSIEMGPEEYNYLMERQAELGMHDYSRELQELPRILKFMQEYKLQHAGINPSTEVMSEYLYGGRGPLDIKKLQNLMRRMALATKNTPMEATEINTFINRLSEDPEGFLGTALLRNNNVAVRISSFEPLTQNITVTPVAADLKTARLYVKPILGETTEETLVRTLSNFDIPANTGEEILQQVEKSTEKYAARTFKFGETKKTTEEILQGIGLGAVLKNNFDYTESVLRSDIAKELLIRSSITVPVNPEERKDLAGAIVTSVLAALKSSDFKHSATAFNKDFIKQLSNFVYLSNDKRNGLLTAMGRNTSVAGKNASLDAALGEEGNFTLADIIPGDVTDLSEMIGKSTVEAREDAYFNHLFRPISGKALLAELFKEANSTKNSRVWMAAGRLADLINSKIKLDWSNEGQVRGALRKAGVSNRDIEDVVQIISNSARSLKNKEYVHLTSDNFGRIYSKSVSTGQWTEEDIAAAVENKALTAEEEAAVYRIRNKSGGRYIMEGDVAVGKEYLTAKERASLLQKIDSGSRIRTELAIKRRQLTTTGKALEDFYSKELPNVSIYQPLLEETVGNLAIAKTLEEKEYARNTALFLLALYAHKNIEDRSKGLVAKNRNIKISEFLLKQIQHTVGFGGSGINIDETGVYFDVGDNIERAKRLVETFGENAFNQGEVAGKAGIIINTDNNSFVISSNPLEMRWDADAHAAKNSGIPGGNAPKGTSTSHVEPLVMGPNIVYDMESGIGFASQEGFSATIPIKQAMRTATFVEEQRISGMTSLKDTDLLPVWTTETGAHLALSMEGGPKEQLRRISEIRNNKEEYLALDIETYGPSYDRLGNVGISIKKYGKGSAHKLYNRSFSGWVTSRKHQTKLNDIAGVLGVSADENNADVTLLKEASNILKRHADKKIIIYNENVDLGKMSVLATRHAERLQQEYLKEKLEYDRKVASGNLSQAQLTQELDNLNKVEMLRADMENAATVFQEANTKKAVNVMFLESAVTPEGGYQALATVAARRGLLEEQENLHLGLADAILTGKVMEAAGDEYSSINPNSWVQKTLNDYKGKILYGSPTRARDPYGNAISLDISNRMLELVDIRVGKNPSTGAEQYNIHLRDFDTDTTRVISVDDALQLSTVLQNLRDSGLTNAQAKVEEERIARDLFQRRIYETLSGERKGTSNFEFEDIDWKFRYANMDESSLSMATKALEKHLEETPTDYKAASKLNWITTNLNKDPRLKRQYVVNSDWYENQYKVYDKPFFDQIKSAMETGKIDAGDAQIIINKRFRELYGGEGVDRSVFAPPKGKSIKPFHEWTITPNIVNPYKIRLASPGLTKYGIEDFALNAFHREYENNRREGIEILTRALGRIANPSDIRDFFDNGGKFTGSKAVAMREAAARHLISNNFRIENRTIEELVKRAAMIPEDYQMPTNMDPVRNLAFGVHEYMKTHMEEQEELNPSLNQEYSGNTWWKGLEGSGYNNREENLKKVAEYDKSLLDIINSSDLGTLNYLLNSEQSRLLKSDPAKMANYLRFSSLNIPETFMGKDNFASIEGLTPSEVAERYGDKGYNRLASLFLRHLEEKQFGRNGGFLNRYQQEDIERLLKWQDMAASIQGVDKGVIRSVNVNGTERNIGEALISNKGRMITLERLFSTHHKEEALEALDAAAGSVSNYFYVAAKRYYDGAPLPGASPTTPVMGAPVTAAPSPEISTVFSDKAPTLPTPVTSGDTAIPEADNSVVSEMIRNINEETKASEGKGPSAAQSSLLINNVWTKTSGRAEKLGEFISGKIPKNADELVSKIGKLLKGKNWIITGAAVLGATMLASRRITNSLNSYSRDTVDSQQYMDTIDHTQTAVHQRVHAIISGSIGSEVDVNEVINAVHATIDLHSTSPSKKSHTITDKREVISRNTAEGFVNKLLR